MGLEYNKVISVSTVAELPGLVFLERYMVTMGVNNLAGIFGTNYWLGISSMDYKMAKIACSCVCMSVCNYVRQD